MITSLLKFQKILDPLLFQYFEMFPELFRFLLESFFFWILFTLIAWIFVLVSIKKYSSKRNGEVKIFRFW